MGAYGVYMSSSVLSFRVDLSSSAVRVVTVIMIARSIYKGKQDQDSCFVPLFLLDTKEECQARNLTSGG